MVQATPTLVCSSARRCDVDRRRRGLRHTLGDLDCLGGALHPRADDDELVASDAPDSVAAAGRTPEAVGRLGEEAITGRVAEAVVDQFEPVEVYEDDGTTFTWEFACPGRAFEEEERGLPVQARCQLVHRGHHLELDGEAVPALSHR